MSFALPDAGRTVVAVHDVGGRLVRTLLRDDRPAGRHSVTWDGRDERGRIVPAGVYFVRLEAGGVQESRTIQRVR
jgi:flagellar hook assembly protein FlgD